MTTLTEIPLKEKRLSIPVSRVKGATNNKVIEVATLETLFKGIIAQNNSPLIKISTKLKELRETDTKAYSEYKTNNCEGFIVGRYEKRADKYCKEYYPLIGFDIDCLTDTPLDIFLSDLKKSPFVFAAFPSPSFKGFRIFIWCDATPETHKAIYQGGCQYLSDFLNIPTDKEQRKNKTTNRSKKIAHIDTGTNNLSRIWFYSHVPKDLFYLNLDSQVFVSNSIQTTTKTYQRPQIKKPISNGLTALSNDEKITIALEKVKRQNPNGRNNFVYAAASDMCRYGVPETLAMAHCQQYAEESFNSAEIRKTVSSAYKSKQFGEFSDKEILAYRKKINAVPGIIQKDIPEKKVEPKKSNVKPVTKPKSEVPEKPLKKSKFVQIEEYILGKYEFRRNIISLLIEYRLKGTKDEFKELNEDDLIVELWRIGFGGIDKMLISLLKSSIVPNYDPFQEYFKSLPEWDNKSVDYIEDLSSYVTLKNENQRKWFNEQFKKMLVRVVACSLKKIPFNKQCLTFVSDQNDGKTTFIRFLCPPKLQSYFKENLDINNKDGQIALVTNFLILFDELEAFSKSDINKAKALFTREIVKERLPYDRKATTFHRRASFFATNNKKEFLTDETGNVRWLVFEINGINHDNGGKKGYNQNVNIDLVWSQAYALLKSGYKFNMNKADIVQSENYNKSYQVVTTEQEFILRRYEPSSKAEYKSQKDTSICFKQAIDILGEINEALPKVNTNTAKIGRAMKALRFKKADLYNKEKKYQVGGYFLKMKNEKESLNEILSQI